MREVGGKKDFLFLTYFSPILESIGGEVVFRQDAKTQLGKRAFLESLGTFILTLATGLERGK